MDESTLWTWGTIGGLALLGAAVAGVLYAAPPTVLATPSGASGFLAAFVFFVLFLAPGLAMQLYRRGYDYATLVGGGAGFAATFCFFATWVGLSFLQQLGELDVRASVMLVVVAPLVVGTLSAGGTLLLSDGVRRYREQHGLKHAPR